MTVSQHLVFLNDFVKSAVETYLIKEVSVVDIKRVSVVV